MHAVKLESGEIGYYILVKDNSAGVKKITTRLVEMYENALKGVKALVKSGGLFSKKTKLSEGGSPNEIAELQELHGMLTKGCPVSGRHCSATAKRMTFALALL